MVTLIQLSIFTIFVAVFANTNAETTQNSTHFITSYKSTSYFNGIPTAIKPTLKFVNLTNIRATPEFLVQALNGCTALETLELNQIEIPIVGNEDFNSTVYLPNLQSFKFSYKIPNVKKYWNANFKSLAFFRKTKSAADENVFNGNVDIDIKRPVDSENGLIPLLKINLADKEIVVENLNGVFVDEILCGLISNFNLKSLKLRALATNDSQAIKVLECLKDLSTLEKVSLSTKSLVYSKSVLEKLGEEGKNLKEVSLNLDYELILDPSLPNLLNQLPITSLACTNTVLDLDWIPANLKSFNLINPDFSKITLKDLFQKTKSLENLQLTNSQKTNNNNLLLNLSELPESIRTIQLNNVAVIYENSPNLNQLESLQLNGGSFQVNSSEWDLPASLKTFSLKQVQTSTEKLIATGITGLNLEKLILESIFEQEGIKFQVTIDLSTLNVPKIKELTFADVELLETKPVEFKNLETLLLTKNVIINGKLSAFKTSPIKYLVFGEHSFAEASFQEVFGSNQHIEEILIKFLGYAIDLAEFPTKSLKKIAIFGTRVTIEKEGVKFDSLEKFLLHFSSLRGSDSLKSLCSALANAKNLNEFFLEGLNPKQDFNLSACFPTENLQNLMLLDLSNLDISEDLGSKTVFPKVTKLDLRDDLDKFDSRKIENLTSIFPAVKHIKLWTSNNTNAYNLVHKLITDSCVQEFETKLERVNANNSADAEFDAKVDQVENFLKEHGVRKNETVVKVFRNKLPTKCNLD